MNQLSLNSLGPFVARRRGGGGGAPVGPGIAALFANVNADGWSVDYASPPTFNPAGSPEQFTVTRAGFNSSGAPITFTENLVCTQRIRQPFPNHATLTADQVAVSDYIYSTDVVTGATNGSTEVSPKPVANWALPANQLVGNSLRLELVCFHRDGQAGEQVAAVEFRVTDGTTTLTQIVNFSSVLGHAGDRFPVIGYACDMDISTLANPATITANAKVFPFIGGAASVLDSADNSGLRAFSPRKYRRDTARLAAPSYAYVESVAGNNTTGAVNTNAATAKAAPCQSIAGAINRAVAVNGTCDGLIIRLMAGDQALTSGVITASRTLSDGAEVIIERDPDSARSACVATLPLVSFRPRLGAAGGQLRFRDVTLTRTAGGDFTGETASHLIVVFDMMTFNNASINSSMISPNASIQWLGTTVNNPSNSQTTAGLRDHLMWRGVEMGAPSINIEAWLVLGCSFNNFGNLSHGSKTPSGSIIAFNFFRNFDTGIQYGSTVGAAVVQNVFETTKTTTTFSIQFADTGTHIHCIVQHNTVAGFFTVGRSNLFYDQTAAPTNSKLHSVRGNIFNQINTKGDRFDSNGALLGNWQFLFGVGCYGQFSMFIDAQSGGIGGSFAQAFPGLGAKLGTSSTVRQDPLFVDYEGVTSGPTAGLGGGNYALQAGSPAKAMLTKPALKFDLAGNARSLTAASAGAYE